MFWAIPALVLAIPLTVIAVIPPVPATIAYGICWTVPFFWCALWAVVTVAWCKREMIRERLAWEAGIEPPKIPSASPQSAEASASSSV